MGVNPALPLRSYLLQLLLIAAINVPTVSFGLALGWVSLASGEGGEGGGGGEGALLGAAAGTFLAGLAGVPLATHALARGGRKPALVACSALFAVCWALKLAGGWGVWAGRAAAGVAGAAAWCVAPLLARECVCAGLHGAAAAAPVVAHNLGFLLMYAAAERRLAQRTVEWCCLALSCAHAALFLAAPESPAYLAAAGRHEGALRALRAARGVAAAHPALAAEAQALPPADQRRDSPLALIKEMLSERARVRAFIVCVVCVVGQECCGVLTLMQFAERVFVLAGAGAGAGEGAGAGVAAMSGAERALVLGAVQFAASLAGLVLVERLGRRRLMASGGAATAAALAGAAGAVWTGHAGAALLALAAAVAADSAALQPAPYALLSDMFHYRYRESAVCVVTAAASGGNAAETLAFGAAARALGLVAALLLGAVLTALLTLFVLLAVPETHARSLDQIYGALDGAYSPPAPCVAVSVVGAPRPPSALRDHETVCTKL